MTRRDCTPNQAARRRRAYRRRQSCPQNFETNRLPISAKKKTRRRCAPRLRRSKAQLGSEYPLVIGGERIKTGDNLDSINPANRTQVVGRFHKATKELANRAVETRSRSFPNLAQRSCRRARRLAVSRRGMLRERKHEFSAWMVHEVAKTWAEADGDTAEAIDFLEFYAREMLRYASDQPLDRNSTARTTSSNTFRSASAR